MSLVLVAVAASSVIYVGGCSSAATAPVAEKKNSPPEKTVKVTDLAAERQKLEADIKSFEESTAAKYSDLENRVTAFKDRLASYREQTTQLHTENAQLDAMLREANPKRILKVPAPVPEAAKSVDPKAEASKEALKPSDPKPEEKKDASKPSDPNAEEKKDAEKPAATPKPGSDDKKDKKDEGKKSPPPSNKGKSKSPEKPKTA